jgi:hypothetical protein
MSAERRALPKAGKLASSTPGLAVLRAPNSGPSCIVDDRRPSRLAQGPPSFGGLLPSGSAMYRRAGSADQNICLTFRSFLELGELGDQLLVAPIQVVQNGLALSLEPKTGLALSIPADAEIATSLPWCSGSSAFQSPQRLTKGRLVASAPPLHCLKFDDGSAVGLAVRSKKESPAHRGAQFKEARVSLSRPLVD